MKNPMKKFTAFALTTALALTTLSGCSWFGGSDSDDENAEHDPYTLEDFDDEAETLSDLNQDWHLAKMELLMSLQDGEPLEDAFEKREEVEEILADIETTLTKMKEIHAEVYANALTTHEAAEASPQASVLNIAFAASNEDDAIDTRLPDMGVLDTVMDFFSGGSFRAADEAMRMAIYTGYHDLVNQYGDEATEMLDAALAKAGINNVENVLYCNQDSMKAFWDERYTLDEGFAERIDWHYTDVNDALQKGSGKDLQAYIDNLTSEIINEEMEEGKYAEYLPRHLSDFVIRNLGYNELKRMINARRETLLRIKNEELKAKEEAEKNEVNLSIQGIYDEMEVVDTVENENYYTDDYEPEDNTEVVIAQNNETGEVIIQEVNTDDTNAISLPPGDYNVTATTDGNAPMQTENVNMEAGQTTVVHNSTYNPQTAMPGVWNFITSGANPPQAQVQIPTITDIHNLNVQLSIQQQLQRELEHSLEILRSMQGGTFTTISMGAKTDLNNKLSQVNAKIKELEKEITEAKDLRAENSPTLDDDDDDDDDDDESDIGYPYDEPTELRAYGTWENSQESGSIDLTFSSHGGPVTGNFSNCIAGECWYSKATGIFDGKDGGTVSGSISGSGGGSYQSFDGTSVYIGYTITGSFSGTVYLSRDFGEGNFNTTVSLAGESYTDSGTWIMSF